MALKISVKNPEEFEQLIKDKNLKISKGIVTGILENLTGKRKNIHVLEVFIEEEDSIVDITVHRDDFIDTLKENLKTHIYHEDYEACVGIQSAIDYLNKYKNEKKGNI
jgi:protein-arginine kinase activator protein McsA|tara:strand:- start:1523 stop:1846 length:324 start_codon:yes stop_codon:yes gene_type:complete